MTKDKITPHLEIYIPKGVTLNALFPDGMYTIFGEDQVHPSGIATVSAASAPTLRDYHLRGIGDKPYPEIVPLMGPHKTEYDPETGKGTTTIFKPETKPKK